MADAFADLWTSTIPKPTEQTLGAAAKSHSQALSRAGTPKALGGDIFSMLAVPRTQSISPTPGSVPISVAPFATAQTSTKHDGGDAFSDLLSNSFSSGVSSKMTMAQAKDQRKSHSPSFKEASQKKTYPSHQNWSGLDNLTANVDLAPNITSNNLMADSWDFEPSMVSRVDSAPKNPAVGQGMDLLDFGKEMPSSSISTMKPVAAVDQWDFFSPDDNARNGVIDASAKIDAIQTSHTDDGWGLLTEGPSLIVRQNQSHLTHSNQDFDPRTTSPGPLSDDVHRLGLLGYQSEEESAQPKGKSRTIVSVRIEYVVRYILT